MTEPAKMLFSSNDKIPPVDCEIDPLDELPHFERSILEFARDNNVWMTLSVGNHATKVQLFRDIMPGFFTLPEETTALSNGASLKLQFPEVGQTIVLNPTGDSIRCEMHGFNEEEPPSYILSKTETISALERLLSGIVASATIARLVENEEAAEFLAPIHGAKEE